MYNLGFPTNAIDVVADSYTNATTRVKLDFAMTNLIDLGRGTIQGGIPPPILFLIFIEPLLRWLHSAGRGYRFGGLSSIKEHAALQNSSSAYADDLAAMTSTHNDMQIQAEKIDAFVNWLGLKVNCQKCVITGILYKQAHGDDNVLSRKHE